MYSLIHRVKKFLAQTKTGKIRNPESGIFQYWNFELVVKRLVKKRPANGEAGQQAKLDSP
jgi:hypothetical protein